MLLLEIRKFRSDQAGRLDSPFADKRNGKGRFKIPAGNNAAPEGFTLEEGDWVDTAERTLAKSLSWQLEAALPAFTTNRILTIPT